MQMTHNQVAQAMYLITKPSQQFRDSSSFYLLLLGSEEAGFIGSCFPFKAFCHCYWRTITFLTVSINSSDHSHADTGVSTQTQILSINGLILAVRLETGYSK